MMVVMTMISSRDLSWIRNIHSFMRCGRSEAIKLRSDSDAGLVHCVKSRFGCSSADQAPVAIDRFAETQRLGLFVGLRVPSDD
jgi:hypothetical protein